MKDIEWSPILSIGVDEVDEDHHKLVEIFNILNHALREDRSPEYLTAVLEELINCTVWHFSHEERLMLEHGYPDRDAHKAEHRDLIASAQGLQREILQGEGRLGEEHLEFLEHWLTEHILTSDMRLGATLSQVM